MSPRAALLREQAHAHRAIAESLDREAALEESRAADLAPDDYVGRPSSIPVTTWRRLVRTGAIPGQLVGRSYLVKKGDLAAYLSSRRVVPRPEPARQSRERPGNDSEVEVEDEHDRLVRQHRR